MRYLKLIFVLSLFLVSVSLADTPVFFGHTSNILRFKIIDSTTGNGHTGMTNATSGLIISTHCDDEATATVYTAAGTTIQTIATLGTYAAPSASNCRFKEFDSTNDPGTYEFQFADARFAVANAHYLYITVSGVTGIIQGDYIVDLWRIDPYNGVNGAMTALPSSAAPGAANGLVINGTNAAISFTGANASGATPATAGMTITGGAASTTGGGVSAAAVVATGGAGAATTNGASPAATFTGGGTTTVAGGAGINITGTNAANAFNLTASGGIGLYAASSTNNAAEFDAGTSGTVYGLYLNGNTGGNGYGLYAAGGGDGARFLGNGAGNYDIAARSRGVDFVSLNLLPSNMPSLVIDGSGRMQIQYGTSTGQLSATAGVANVNESQINSVSTSPVTTVNANIGSTQPLNFTGTGASALLQGDTRDWLGGTIPSPNVTGVPLTDLKYTLGTLSPAAAGSVSIDWSHVVNATNATNLSSTTLNLVNTVTAYTGNTPQTGDAYALANNATYGLAHLTRSATPANALAIDSNGFITYNNTSIATVTNPVTVGTNNDKTGYSLTQGFPSGFASWTAPLTSAQTDAAVWTATDNTGTANSFGQWVSRLGNMEQSAGGGNYQFTTTALALAPTGGGGSQITLTSGTAQGGTTTTTLTLQAGYSNVSQLYRGNIIVITGGTGQGEVGTISNYAAGVVTVNYPWPVVPDSTSQYTILPFGGGAR